LELGPSERRVGFHGAHARLANGPRGPDRGSKRLRIPANLVGKCSDFKHRETYEDHALNHSSKVKKNMSKAEQQSFLAEMGQGFSRLDDKALTEAAMFTPLGPSALTTVPGVQAESVDLKTVLLDAAGMASTSTPAPDASNAVGAAGRAAPASIKVVDVEEPTSAKKPRKDFAVERNKAYRTHLKDVQDEQKKMHNGLKSALVVRAAADESLDSADIAVLQERIDVAMHCTGVIGAKSDSSDAKAGSPDDIDLQPRQYLDWEDVKQLDWKTFESIVIGVVANTLDDARKMWGSFIAKSKSSDSDGEVKNLDLKVSDILNCATELGIQAKLPLTPPIKGTCTEKYILLSLMHV
jgi:hypothetical protein